MQGLFEFHVAHLGGTGAEALLGGLMGDPLEAFELVFVDVRRTVAGMEHDDAARPEFDGLLNDELRLIPLEGTDKQADLAGGLPLGEPLPRHMQGKLTLFRSGYDRPVLLSAPIEEGDFIPYAEAEHIPRMAEFLAFEGDFLPHGIHKKALRCGHGTPLSREEQGVPIPLPPPFFELKSHPFEGLLHEGEAALDDAREDEGAARAPPP